MDFHLIQPFFNDFMIQIEENERVDWPLEA